MSDWLRERATGSAITVGLVIVAMQFFLPALLDLLFDMVLIGLIWFVSKSRS